MSKPPVKTDENYTGDDPLRLAIEIERALKEFGIGLDRRMFNATAIQFYEGELRLIAKALRCLASRET